MTRAHTCDDDGLAGHRRGACARGSSEERAREEHVAPQEQRGQQQQVEHGGLDPPGVVCITCSGL